MYQVKAGVFEGPLDLLLTLIEKRKLFINDISLAKVADDYMSHMRALEELPLKDTAHFILIASTLVLIKSKSLLPSLTLTEEEGGDIKELEERLRLYKHIRQLSRHVRARFGRKMIFARAPTRRVEPVFSPDKHTNTASILSAIKSVLNELPKKEVLSEAVVKKVISLEEMIRGLTERMEASLKVSFQEFTQARGKERVHVIVGFLAMLELVKRGLIKVAQEEHFGDISIESSSVNS